MYRQHTGNTLLHALKHLVYIAADCCGRRYLVFWPSGLHQGCKSAIFDNVERPHTLQHPPDNFCSSSL